MKKAAFCTLGCRVNQYETEAMEESFISRGYQIVDFAEKADVYVINTCTVTNIGDKKSRQMIRKAKRTNADSIIVVAGCYSQIAPDEVLKIDGVDIVVGTSQKSMIVDFVDKFKSNGKRINSVMKITNVKNFENLNINEYQERTRAFLKIQDGCDRYCSYCLIPFARGPVRSRKPQDIIDEVKRLSQNGYREIILSGIHVASYGKDLGDINLVDIIEKIQIIDGIDRIRIGSVDPMFFRDNVIERISKISKLCPHFHLSLQSGCDETLKRMNRQYTSREYMDIVNTLRKKIDDISITTDLIVGFPGETDEEFSKTVKFLEDIKLSKIHIFKFSPRKGTQAALMDFQLSPEVKEKRSKLIMELDKKYETEFIKKFINRNVDVLFEEGDNNKYYGYTKNYIKVVVESNSDLEDKIRNVNLYGVHENVALGKVNISI